MSKPIERWINTVWHDNGHADHDIQMTPCPNGSETYLHVIEKSAADKLAEALEWIASRFETDFQSACHADQALKEYRGEK